MQGKEANRLASDGSYQPPWNLRRTKKQALVRRMNSLDLQSVQAEQGKAGITAGPMSPCKAAERSILSKQIFVTWNKLHFEMARSCYGWSGWNMRKINFSHFSICVFLEFLHKQKKDSLKRKYIFSSLKIKLPPWVFYKPVTSEKFKIILWDSE